MKMYWKNGDENPFEGTPFAKGLKFMVEPTQDAFWCFPDGQRDAGCLPQSSLSRVLKWILQQIALGHFEELKDKNGDVVSLVIGKGAPLEFDSADHAAENASGQLFGLQLAGLFAEAREKGSHPTSMEFEKKVWNEATESAQRRVELHYAVVLAKLLGRISKKLPQLELLPIMEKAPPSTKEYMAEATRCCLLKMDRACIALCRACIENTLKDLLTESMKAEWLQEIIINKKNLQDAQSMRALIEVCTRHGKLDGCAKDAHEVRDCGNRILHLRDIGGENTSDMAWRVLEKTRKIIGLIYGGSQQGAEI